MPACKNTGFSLVELLVVMTIISVLMGVGMMSFSNIQQDQTLKKAASQVRSTLYEARQMAFFGKRPAGCTTPFNGVQVSCAGGLGTSSLTLESSCGSPPSTYLSLKTVTFDKSVNLTCPPSIEFTSVTQNVSSSADYVIVVGTKNNTVTVTNTAQIQ